MRYSLFLIFSLSKTQGEGSKQTTMELSNTVLNGNILKRLVEEKFQPIKMTKMEKFVANHPLQLLNFNRTVKDITMRFSFFGMPVKNVYVYQNDRNEFCTYLIIEIPFPSFEKLFATWKYPENVTEEQYRQRDYQFMYWNIDGFAVFINKNHGADSRDEYVIQVVNMPYGDIMDMTMIN
jgi:hypothetical protein